jgi:hypothetical protein
MSLSEFADQSEVQLSRGSRLRSSPEASLPCQTGESEGKGCWGDNPQMRRSQSVTEFQSNWGEREMKIASSRPNGEAGFQRSPPVWSRHQVSPANQKRVPVYLSSPTHSVSTSLREAEFMQ